MDRENDTFDTETDSNNPISQKKKKKKMGAEDYGITSFIC